MYLYGDWKVRHKGNELLCGVYKTSLGASIGFIILSHLAEKILISLFKQHIQSAFNSSPFGCCFELFRKAREKIASHSDEAIKIAHLGLHRCLLRSLLDNVCVDFKS